MAVRCLATLSLLVLAACDGGSVERVAENDSTRRWYDGEQVARGRALFDQHCSSCHGEQARGLTADWKQRLEDGSFPPPPLDGSAHAWHHPLSVLDSVIAEGGVPLGGKMPAFEQILDAQQRRAVVAYFQSFWSDEIYADWLQMGGTN